MEPQVMKINGNEFALIVSSDGKEQALVLPSELSELTRAVSAEGKGRLVTIPSSTNLHLAQTQSISQNRTLVPGTSSQSNVSGWSEKELTNWAPKLGTDLDSKWLQRNEIDYLVSHPTNRNENQQSQSVLNPMKTQELGNTYIPLHLEKGTNIPIVAKVDPHLLRQRLTSVALKPTGVHTLVTNKAVNKDLSGTTKNMILVSRGQMAGGVKQNIQGGNLHGKSEAGNLYHYLGGQGLNIKTLEMAKSAHEQSVVSPVYKSKLEKAIAQNNLNNTANPQSLNVTQEQKTGHGTLKQLLNTGEYKLKLSQNVQLSQTYDRNIGFDNNSLPETRPMTSLLEADILKELEARSSELSFMNPSVQIKPLKTKPRDQTITMANEINKTFIQSEKPQYFKMGDQTIEISQPRTISKPVPDKIFRNLTQSLKPHSQVFINNAESSTPITSLIQLNQSPATVSSCSVYTGVKARIQDGRDSVQSVQSEVIVEKEYIDSNLAREILDAMWQLREKELFCDAIIFAGDKQVKLHKIVLAGVSTVMHTKVVDSGDGELFLQLPQDITYDHLMLFVSYLYHGRLLLTVDNVQQLYRLSGLFSMEQLKKHCYEFCRLSKMGHLIISCPYQEAAKQVVDVPKSFSQPAADIQTTKLKSDPKLVIPQVSEPDPVFSQTSKQSQQTKTQSKKEVKDTDIDWMNSDPSQSNIPIRKRGRTRKGLTSPSGGSTTDNLIEIRYNTNTSPRQASDIVMGDNSEVQHLHNSTKKDLPKSRSELPKKKAVARESLKPKDIVSVDKLAQQVTELPDPLATGKIDETELLKIVPTGDELSKKSPKKGIRPTPNRSMVTRFRNRPKNMSVIEAAAQKKAKSNDTSSVYTSKTPKQNSKGKRLQNVAKFPKSAGKGKTKNEKPEITDQAKQKSRTEKSPVLAGMLAKKLSPTHDVLKKSNIYHKAETNIENRTPSSIETVNPSRIESKIKSNLVIKSSNPVNFSPQKDINTPLKETTIPKRPLDESTALVINFDANSDQISEEKNEDNQSTVPTPPKKSRQRKLTIDQPDGPKDTVYMRPPPKKRTKEIREMMKNEDVVIEEEKTMAAIDSLIQFPENNSKEITEEIHKTVPNVDEKPMMKKSRKKLVKDDLLMQQVYDIELSGKLIEGEKQYKCCLCNSVFIFARRAVTHLVNTHDMHLEESYQNVVVEPRSAAPKICDICGYQTKELNVYYIHYHKYFRHGVPLPKGWQPFTCDLCKKEFFTKFQLREHKLIHFEDNPFVCEHCGSGFKSRTCLNSHVFHKHNPVRRHACNMCPKTFKTATQLKVHKRVHSGDKPFACPDLQCSYRSTTRGNMRLHLINRHKYSNDNTKDIMITLQPSAQPEPKEDADVNAENHPHEVQSHEPQQHDSLDHCPSTHHEWMDNGQEQADLNEDRAVAMAADPATLTTLVEAAVAEVNSAGGYTVHSLNETGDNHEHGMTSVLPSVESMATHLIDQNQVAHQTNREYDIGIVHQANMVQGMNYSDQQDHCETLTVHVPMTVQAEQDMHHNSNMLMQNEEQSGGDMQGYHQDINQHSLMVIPHQDYTEQDFATPSQSYIIPQDPRHHMSHSHQIPLKTRLDPGSREARMIVKQALQGHEPRNLLKATILKGGSLSSGKFTRSTTNEGSSLSLDTRTLTRDHLPQNIHQFAEDSTLVIDTQTHQDSQLVIDTDQVVQDNQLQEQFRGAHSNTMFRGGQDINLTNHSQHQGLEPQHLQSFQSSSMAPPLSYSGSSHSLITSTPVSELSTSHANLTLTSVDQDHFQGEDIQHGQVQQGQVYDNNVAQSQISTQVSSDGSMYVGYYQQHFPIENY